MLVFTNSSHGTYLADTDGDEDRFDEAMCPWDCDDRLIVDDELRALFDELPAGVRCTSSRIRATRAPSPVRCRRVR